MLKFPLNPNHLHFIIKNQPVWMDASEKRIWKIVSRKVRKVVSLLGPVGFMVVDEMLTHQYAKMVEQSLASFLYN
jgi:hypothetical protein